MVSDTMHLFNHLLSQLKYYFLYLLPVLKYLMNNVADKDNAFFKPITKRKVNIILKFYTSLHDQSLSWETPFDEGKPQTHENKKKTSRATNIYMVPKRLLDQGIQTQGINCTASIAFDQHFPCFCMLNQCVHWPAAAAAFLHTGAENTRFHGFQSEKGK